MIPPNAIIGGFDIDKSPLYICRHTLNKDLIPGKANPKTIGCEISSGGSVHDFKDGYEILVGDNFDWVSRHGGDPIPSDAYPAGNDANGAHIYIGRCNTNRGSGDTTVIGKIHHWFYYGFGNKEYNDCDNHQVLIC